MEIDAVRRYGDGLAVLSATRRGVPALDGVRAALPAATARPVRLVVVDTACGSAAGDGDVLRLAEDVGRAAALNRAVAGLEPSVGWVVLTDPGVRWRPGAIDALLDAAARHPRAGLLGPRLYAADAAVASGGALPGVLAAARGRIPHAVVSGPTGWLSTAAALVRRTAWDSVDGLDGRYLGGPGEIGDVDLGDRLAAAGWLVVAVPGAGAEVEPGDTFECGHGILEAHAAGLHRYVRDRASGPVRALAALAGRRRP
ncbi:glycosyltransferase family 2 protein [Pseudonocardia kunmingensis]|uniref:glycosyltransferase family 2 protein n=1 Tax=Pseudonocardia kunmingensis TaxID=630975 RepID=UPI00115173F2|nr:glycosyltransferase family 2 protein [Pseudonocardia kunmingensis]